MISITKFIVYTVTITTIETSAEKIKNMIRLFVLSPNN